MILMVENNDGLTCMNTCTGNFCRTAAAAVGHIHALLHPMHRNVSKSNVFDADCPSRLRLCSIACVSCL